jgi:recombination protein RecR
VYSPAIQNLIDQLARLPGVGPKTAQRLAFHLLRLPREEAVPLATAIITAKDTVGFCARCFNLTDEDLCEICKDPRRDETQLCVVEEPVDVIALERTHGYRGLYHVLGGALSPIDGVGPERLRLGELFERVRSEKIQEVVVATNPNTSGEATALYIAQQLRGDIEAGAVRVTRLAAGLPMGADLEYADEITLGRALSGRHEL